ncbi:MAG: dioxygenase [Bacteroidales bacterium]|jgi:aromatic ring-opening dioxygenase catalytic subunit (LigB family)|nr:dioxygenase [Bacteroidales bacterium]
MKNMPVYFIPHGGGPWHVMDDAMGDPVGYRGLRTYLTELGQKYRPKIKAILVVSAHWEENVPTIHFGQNPPMYYDYYGFPEFTYHLEWNVPGHPQLAEKVETLLNNAGFKTKREYERGFDHGTFVPLMIAFPEAKIPIVQLSLVHSLDPATHLAMGKALEPLREQDVLIIGSGMSYHNMRGFMSGSSSAANDSKLFDDWLTATVEKSDPDKRNESLVNWEKAPGAKSSHPRSEHLIPLFVAAGAAGNDAGTRDYAGTIMEVNVSGYKFG